MIELMETPKTLGLSVIFGLHSRFAPVVVLTRRGGRKRSDFSMVRIRLARFALPQLGYSGSKSGVSCSSLVCRVRGTIENVRASAERPGASSPNLCRLASLLALVPLNADRRRLSCYARVSARSPRTRVTKNTTLIHRSSPTGLTYAA